MAQADADHLKLFTGRANPLLAQKICEHLQIPLGRGKTELFPDGELLVKIEEDVPYATLKSFYPELEVIKP